MGSKTQRQNQYVKKLERKIKKFKLRGWNITGLEKELEYCMGETRPEFRTGMKADQRLKKFR